MIVKDFKEVLEKLLMAHSPSGMEHSAIAEWDEAMRSLGCVKCYSDKIGNSAFKFGHGPKKILLSGHIDELSARVNSISDSGIITVINTGGMCPKSLIASHVDIITYNGIVHGIVEKTPIHCEEDDESKKVEDINKMRINVGATTKEEVVKMGIRIGNVLTYTRNTNLSFGKNLMVSQGLDDKIGVFITYCILYEITHLSTELQERIANEYTIIALAATQEETGLRGATVAAKAINPDVSIDFDVTFATDGDSGINKNLYGDIKLGGGAVIQYGPDKSERLNRLLSMTAEFNDIPFQRNASWAGGTNTNAIQLHSADCETTLISIPNRNMHTPIEVCDWRDVQSIIDLVSTTIRTLVL